jgi:hypothetical protein
MFDLFAHRAEFSGLSGFITYLLTLVSDVDAEEFYQASREFDVLTRPEDIDVNPISLERAADRTELYDLRPGAERYEDIHASGPL